MRNTYAVFVLVPGTRAPQILQFPGTESLVLGIQQGREMRALSGVTVGVILASRKENRVMAINRTEDWEGEIHLNVFLKLEAAGWAGKVTVERPIGRLLHKCPPETMLTRPAVVLEEMDRHGHTPNGF